MFDGDPRTSTPAWRKLRRQILERDDHRCRWTDQGVRCGASANEVDHIVRPEHGGTDHPSNLRALCTPHHARKTALEANAARWRHKTKRPTAAHPGLKGGG